MTKLTVKQYASSFAISTQATYQQIAKGVLKCISENGKKYVIVDDMPEQATLQEVAKPLANDLTSYWQDCLQKKEIQLDDKDAEIKRLNEELVMAKEEITKAKEHENIILLQYIDELKQLQLAAKPVESASIDIDIEPEVSKKSKKKSKSKKKK